MSNSITNVINMSNLFNGCSSLISLNDISNWKTQNVRNIKNMFKGCSKLFHIPDIYKWKIIILYQSKVCLMIVHH